MKKLSNKRISELIDKAINDMNEWNNSHTIDEYVINSIRNINLIDDEKKLKDELKYWSCSSNYWIGVSALMTAYEERLDNKDEEYAIIDAIISSNPTNDLLMQGQSAIILDKNNTDVCQINPDGTKEIIFKVKNNFYKVEKRKFKLRKDV
jgi:hypothetical protein|uniref:Uncharacterized protein n=1 Tax=Myoviridae sp. ctNQV2 TaxID=2827683 RepID=A0A8S5RYP8_9CAUD|nr:MAG TPA: hypothetical protein [Myoviridae sp. ctNQV2]